MTVLHDDALDQIFREARTFNAWLEESVSDELLQQVYDLAKMGPTSANCCPMRIAFVKSPEAKEKLKPCLDEGNVEKTMAAPVTAIIAQDMTFYDELPKLYPHADARSWFVGKDGYIAETAFRNSSLQGAYFIIAARAMGLDCGPMSGFNKSKTDETFFSGTPIRSNFLINLGYGNQAKLYPRSPRLGFDDACKIT